MDRIIKFGEGQYKYDSRGLVIQNAREEKFHYNAKGLLVRATKRGRFDVKYYYDHMDRYVKNFEFSTSLIAHSPFS